jgi:hypothetical protein
MDASKREASRLSPRQTRACFDPALVPMNLFGSSNPKTRMAWAMAISLVCVGLFSVNESSNVLFSWAALLGLVFFGDEITFPTMLE